MNLVGAGPIIQHISESKTPKTNLLLLDRDGTLNFDQGYTHKTSALKIIKNNVKNIREFAGENTVIYCISNQSGIGRGFFTVSDVENFNKKLAIELKSYKLNIEKFIFCPHVPEDRCFCRKPQTEMIEIALQYSLTSKAKSTFIGNTNSDALASLRAGINYIDVGSSSFKRELRQRREMLDVYN
jgi:histidinol-phosphate phosphatase family protein